MPSFKKFEQEILKTLRKKEVSKLVIDVSNNSGGSSAQGTELAKKIASVYDGKTYVITGKKTFSAAVLNTLDFQQLLDAEVIGEITSGKPNHYGEIQKMEMHHSGSIIYYSTKYFKKVEGDPPGIIPDVYQEATFEEYINGINPAWEYIKQL